MSERATRGTRRAAATRRVIARAGGRVMILALAAMLLGCESDSFINPSVVGRWEHTPTIVPVLERVDVIEQDSGEFVDVTQVKPEDLIPEPVDYRVAPGDFLRIEIADFIAGGVPGQYERTVDQRGFVSIPQVGRIYVADLTRVEVQQAIVEAVREADILDNAIVTVQVPGARQATYSIFGAVAEVGRYTIPTPDFRILDAITDSGGIGTNIKKLYVIRQVPLSREFERGAEAEPERKTPDIAEPEPSPEEQGEEIGELIEELLKEEEREQAPPPDGGGSDQGVINFGAFASKENAIRGVLGSSGAAVSQDGLEPPIDLPDGEDEVPVPGGEPPSPTMELPSPSQAPRWLFLEGEWVQVMPSGPIPEEGLPEGEDPLEEAVDVGDLVTQRVIEIPTEPLFQGVARYNIVVRPGDRISVRPPPQGLVYVGGPGIVRPGVYTLPVNGRLTLTKAIYSAGGLSGIAIPERVDLTRMIGDDRQATVRLNLRAIFEGTQPDLFLKPDDVINVGTNFWATPLAVVRGGFRTSYGFGFLLDRNFGNDVFGPPPTNRFGE